MTRKSDPLRWPRLAAKHPVGEYYRDPTTEPPRFLYAINRLGAGLYEAQPPTGQVWWIRYPDDSWLQGKHAPVGTRWHVLAPEEQYAAQRLRIDPAWQPDEPGVE